MACAAPAWSFRGCTLKGALLDILKTKASFIDNDKIMARLYKNINLELFSLCIASTCHHTVIASLFGL